MLFLELDVGRKLIRKFGAMICDLVYWIIARIYELFITVARLNILSSDEIAPIYQRITMILTIVMTFYITFEFVKYTIEPDTFTDKEKGAGNILKRVVIVIVLIAFVPQLFSMAYKLQNRIIETQLISKVILGTGSTNYESYGNEFAANMLNLFYYVDESACSNNNGDCKEARQVVEKNLNQIRTTGDPDIQKGINLSSENSLFKEKLPAIQFNGLLAIIVGGFIAYILALYSIDVGTRYAQLIFLQIISPIAIMGYILPKKDGIFQKWGKQCITTYIDLFIRIAIINFVLLIVKVLGDAFESGSIFDGIGKVSGTLKTFSYIVLVMGLLAFAQRAPKLLGELLPSSGAAGIGFGLGAKNRLEPTTNAVRGAYRTTGRVVGGVAGMAAGAYIGARQNGWREAGKNRVWSAIKGATKGATGGFGKNGGFTRGVKAARESVRKDRDIIASGGTPLGATFRGGHYSDEAKTQDITVARYEQAKQNKDAIRSSADEYKEVKQLKTAWESAKQGGLSKAQIDDAYAKYKNARDAMIAANATGPAAAGAYTYTYTDSTGTHTSTINVQTDEVNKFSRRVHDNIEASRRSIAGTEVEDMLVTVNRGGVNVNVEVRNLTDAEYAEKIGDISDLSETEISRLKNSTDYKRAHANAEASGKK